MLISLHKQATTTPKVRAAIQASTEPAWMLAERHGISEQTVWKWRKRDGVHDRSHTAHRLQTTLTPAQEAVAVALRTTLLLPLDDLLAVAREFLNPHVSRSGLDRCLRRHGVGNLRELKPKVVKPAYQPFKAYEPGYLHLDVKYLPQMADEQRRRYLFVAIDRATRWVFVRVYRAKTAANARRFLRDLERAAPMKISRVLTDNGKEFTDRLFGLRRRAATGNHDFDRLCTELDIEHRLAPPRRPQTNGMVERFNGRIEDVLQSHRFRSGEDLQQTILRYVRLYNTQLPQSVLKGDTPIDALKNWHRRRPELFRKQPYNHAGCDRYPMQQVPSGSGPECSKMIAHAAGRYSTYQGRLRRRAEGDDDPQRHRNHGRAGRRGDARRDLGPGDRDRIERMGHWRPAAPDGRRESDGGFRSRGRVSRRPAMEQTRNQLGKHGRMAMASHQIALWLRTCLSAMCRAAQRRRSLRRAADLPDYLLRDVGLTRGQLPLRSKDLPDHRSWP